MLLLNPTKFGSSLFPSQKINPQLTTDSLTYRNRPNMQLLHMSSSLSTLNIQR
ncbi:hypothetical protein K501DRAFT_288421, partial [Backusella circina FSU 941]